MNTTTFSRSVLLMAAATLFSACSGDDDDSKAIDLTLLHMNDHHSHLEAETFDFAVDTIALETRTAAGEDVAEVEVSFGGFPMITTLFKQLEADNDNVIKIHAGDAVTGTLYYTLFEGEADAAMMNEICFDVFALGNHEFDSGDNGLAKFLDHLNDNNCGTTTLAANVSPASGSAIADGYIEPYTVIKVDGEKVGLIGIDIAGKTKNSSNPDDGTTFADETATSQQFIDELKADGVNKIILVTHYQYSNDLELAANLSGVDVIVGGDSHSLLGDSTFSDLGFNPVGEYPTVVTNADGDTVCVVQAWEYSHLMGKLDVSFDKEGKVTHCGGSPLMPIARSFQYEHGENDTRELSSMDTALVEATLTAHPELIVVEEDQNTATVLAAYESQTESLKAAVIGTVESDLCLERWPGQARSLLCEAANERVYKMGSDISNIVAKGFLMATPTADIAIQNGGGVRVDVAAGEYTIADAYTLLPFSNTLVTLEMTGQQIIEVLEDALSNTLDNNGSTGSYPYASGLRYNVDASQDKGERITTVEVNSRVQNSWAPINVSATYTVVTNNFIASGQDGYTTFGTVFDAGDYVDTYTEYAQGFIDYVKMLSTENETLNLLPSDEYSTQHYIATDGCDHNTTAGCGY
ncbi:NAD nucleotidase [Teredinibacter haidensis]|uniref:NAD nucleotidase n=1 Tax=Teredinibacter haidensis TaxID=2731755 RepID=UPI0009490C55|nr:NAD nucleotidase [Teredinibacter haidensis]